MTNPEAGLPNTPGYERSRAQELVSELSLALDAVAFTMTDLHRSAVFTDVDKFVPEEMLEKLYSAVDAARGYPVEGELRINKYLVTNDGTTEIGTLPYRRHGNYDFQGVLDGIGRVSLEGAAPGSTFEQLCLIVNPLYLLGDPELSANYAQKGWIAQLRHPFASEERQDKPLYLPVNMISEKGLQLVDRWKLV